MSRFKEGKDRGDMVLLNANGESPVSLTDPHPINATGPVSWKICGWNVPLPKKKHIYLLRTWWMRGPHCPPLSPMSSLWCLFINGQIMKEQEEFRSSLKTVFVRFYPPGSLGLQNIFKSGSPSSPLILFATHHLSTKVIFLIKTSRVIFCSLSSGILTATHI